MNILLEKLNKISLPAVILIASLILGGFFYASQVSKQRSIERQQQIKIEQEKQDQLAKEIKEQQAKEEVVGQAQLNAQLLDNCLIDAQSMWLEWGRDLTAGSKKCDTHIGGARTGCQDAYIEGYNKNDVQLQQDKNECFKRYPQK